MKYQKLVNELNNLLDSAARRHHKHQKKIKLYLGQFRTAEQGLHKKLAKEKDKNSRRKLKRELSAVRKSYAVLGS